jgi:16S rRNA (cytosine967-C5)-methyltransferase
VTKGNPGAREQALHVLNQVLEQGAYSNVALQRALRGVAAQDAALIKQLVYGTLTYRRSLDYLLEQWLSRPLEKLRPAVRNLLRMGLYQILYLRIPDHAAVAESVRIAHQVGHRGVAGLVNAVLRRAIREQEQLPWPQTGDVSFDLSIRYSFPEWMVQRWIQRLGEEEAARLCAAQNTAPRLEVRLNSLRTDPEQLVAELEAAGVGVCSHPLVENSLQLENAVLPQLAALQAGRCVVQSAASTLVGQVVDPAPQQVVYDVCAAPGGKTLHLAELMRCQGRVLALDLHAHRLRLLERTAQRLGINCVELHQADATRLVASEWPAAARVLVDAPCSGLGVIRRKPDIRWNRSLPDIQALADIQLAILRQVADLVEPEGILVYSVCSTEPEETEQVVQAFLVEDRRFAPAGWPAPLQAVFGKEIQEGCLTTYPHRHDLDGFFICRLQRVK